MASKNRSGNANKRAGSRCHHKMMSAKQKARRTRIYLYSRRQQSNLKMEKALRQQALEHKFAA